MWCVGEEGGEGYICDICLVYEFKSLVKYFSYYLTEAEKTISISQWPGRRTRLVRQRIINPNKALTNLLALRLDDVRDFLILLDLILTLSSSAAKCERGSLKE